MKWTIKHNDNNKKWYFFIDAVENEQFTVPDYKDIVAEASTQGLPAEDLISAKQFERYFEKVIYGKTLPLPLEIELEPSFDTRLIIEPDKTKAEVYIRKGKSKSDSVDKKLIINMLNNSGIKNINFQALQEALTAFSETADREIEIVVSEGILPERGSNRTLIPHITTLQEEEDLILRKKLLHAVETAREQAQMIYDKDFPLSEAEFLALVNKNDLLYELSKSEIGADGSDIYGNPVPGLPGNDPFVLDLRNIIQSSNELKAACSGILLIAQRDEELKIRIIPYKDAVVKAVISEDSMEALLVMESGRGAGTRLTLSRMKKALDDIELPSSCYSDELLQEAIHEARLSSSPIEFTICRGVVPVAPRSYRFDWKVNFDHSNTAPVKRGMLILETTFLDTGEEGTDVFGNTIGIDTAAVLKLPQTDDTITVTKEGKKVSFVAAVTGEFAKAFDTLTIVNTKTIDSDITEDTGDILFAGDLVINGNIDVHRSVKAGGFLTINGDAGASLVYTKESLLMKGGIRGEGRGTVWAKNSMALYFAETARLLAGGNMHIDQYCFRCTVKTNGKLSVTGDPGSFIGGNAHAACGMQVRNLGDYKTVRTIISFGQNYLIKDKIDLYEKEVQANLLDLARIDAELSDVEATKEHIQELRAQKVSLMKANTALGLEIFKLKENFESHIESEIRITGTAYPGVILESHGRYYEIREPASHVVFTFDPEKGRIICKPIEDTGTPAAE